VELTMVFLSLSVPPLGQGYCALTLALALALVLDLALAFVLL
jgi:hypothetical protein